MSIQRIGVAFISATFLLTLGSEAWACDGIMDACLSFASGNGPNWTCAWVPVTDASLCGPYGETTCDYICLEDTGFPYSPQNPYGDCYATDSATNASPSCNPTTTTPPTLTSSCGSGETCSTLPTSVNGDPTNTYGSGCAAGDPCNISNGANWHVEQTVSIAARTAETALTLKRTYVANAAAPMGDFGPNWRHNWESALFSAPDGSGNLIWIDDYGGPWTFTLQSNGSFQSPPGQFAQLTSSSSQYTLRFPNGVQYSFSNGTGTDAAPAGKLLGITDAHGESVNLSYNSNGVLLSISNTLAGSLTLTRNSAGQIATITRSIDGLSYAFTYNSAGVLSSTTDYDGNTTSYTYVINMAGTNAQGMLTSITDPLGRVYSTSYYSNGTVQQQTEHGGAVRSFVYAGAGTAQPTTTVTDIDGQITTYKFNSNLKLIEADLPDGSITTHTWNAQNLIASQTDELGNTTQYQYDNNGNTTQITRPDGSVTQITYDQTWNKPILLTPALGAVSSWSLNSSTGDVLGMAETDPVSHTALSLGYTVDSFGGVLATNNGLSTYANQRDANGLLTGVFDLYNPEILKYDTLSRLIERDYQSGRVLSYTYDNLNRLTKISDTHGPSTLNTFDAVGRLTSQTITDGVTLQTTAFQYDARDRITQVTDALGHMTKMSYDIPVSNGLIVLSQPITVTDPNGHVTKFTYDNRDRRITQTDATGAITQYGYDKHSNLVSLSDPDLNKTVFKYDMDNRLVEQDRPSQIPNTEGVAEPTTDVTKYLYNAIDELISKTESSATGTQTAITSQAFDPFNRLIERKQYLAIGTKSTVMDDSVFTYQSELDATLLSSANNGVENLSFSFASSPPFASKTYSVQAVDPKNALSLIQDSYTVSRDVTGNIAGIQNLSDQSLLTETYDPAGRLLCVISGNVLGAHAKSLNAQLVYDTFGRKHEVEFSTERTGTFQYDLLNRISALQWQGKHPDHDISEQLVYDPAGNIETQTREFGALQYGYDPVNEITSVTANGNKDLLKNEVISQILNESFKYDLAGNRTDDSSTGVAKFLANQIVSDDHTKFETDPNGFGNLAEVTNEETRVSKNFTYRPDGKLVLFTKSGDDGEHDRDGNVIVSATYSFDALGRRVAKQISYHSGRGWDGHSQATYTQAYSYLVDQNKVLLAQSGDGTLFEYLDGQGIDEHLGVLTEHAVKSFETDHLGSVLNSSAAGVFQDYSAFGVGSKALASSSRSSDPVEYGFAGRQLDGESGDYYNRARMYNPNTGRFMNQDPIGLAGQDINLYRYTVNNPLNGVDPYGLQTFPIFGGSSTLQGIVAGIGGGAALGGALGSVGAGVGIVPGGIIGGIIGGIAGAIGQNNPGPIQNTVDGVTGTIIGGGVGAGIGSLGGAGFGGAIIGGAAGGAYCSGSVPPDFGLGNLGK